MDDIPGLKIPNKVSEILGKLDSTLKCLGIRNKDTSMILLSIYQLHTECLKFLEIYKYT